MAELVAGKLSLDAIRSRAAKFAKTFKNVTSEKQRDQDYMRGFCEVFGINPNRLQWQFILKNGKTTTWADGVLPGTVLFEMKSLGKDMDAAYQQAADYVKSMQDKDVPKMVVVSDFANIHVYDQTTGSVNKFALEDLPQQVDSLKLLAGYETRARKQQNEANELAAEKIGRLHDIMKANQYNRSDLETYLVRLLFCLFADDTGLFGENDQLLSLLENTKLDGTDLHGELSLLFNTLNKDYSKRASNLSQRMRGFPYVNGALFAEPFSDGYEFDEFSRKTLLELAADNWSDIDPSIFGSLFQTIMHYEDEAADAKTKKRRELGAHYTSEENILKVINPLFMDDLRAEFAIAKRSAKNLGQFHDKLSKLQIFDPACGCGNFLVVAYRELRLLELDVIEALHGKGGNTSNVALMVRLDVDQFHGIEIDSTAARIATVAMWLTDHQMNMKLTRLGAYSPRLPLLKRPNIVCANALQTNWETVIEPEKCSYIVGNPPFIGRQYQSNAQKEDLALVFSNIDGAGVLDYVAAWHVKAARYIQHNEKVQVTFVSTNSISQGEQVAILWKELLRLGIYIHFAHRTFRWSNEGHGVAAVHCVIIGFGKQKPDECRLFDYPDGISEEPTEIKVAQINPYLVDAPTVLIDKRRKPIFSNAPEMIFGNMPNDGGNLLLTAEEADHIRKTDKIAAKYIKPFLGAAEFINNGERYCLWLLDSTAADRKASAEIQRRTAAVKSMRLASNRSATNKLAEEPYLFGEIRHTGQSYLLIPRVSSEQRAFVPIGYLPADVIASDAVFVLPNASLYHFGLLASTFHNAWVRTVGGRLKSDYRYSNAIIYNNFPWPQSPTAAQKKAIEAAAQAVLDARLAETQRAAKQHQSTSLADLYAVGTMPSDLLKAHKALNKAVDAAYTDDGFDKRMTSEADRVAFLFRRYQALTAPLDVQNPESAPVTTKAKKKSVVKKK